jgi:hypothetical protein
MRKAGRRQHSKQRLRFVKLDVQLIGNWSIRSFTVGVHPYVLTPLVRFYITRVLTAVLDTIYESHLSSVNDTNSDDS